MAFTVSKSSQSLVTPCEPTPAGAALSLSFLDTHPAHYYLAQLLQVFPHGENPAAVLRRAVSKALVPFYPLAGRLVESDHGELQVACTGEGMWFVDAHADCTLEDVDYLDHPRKIPAGDLLPYPPDNKNPLHFPALMQVTTFTCGGFAVSFVSNHAITDGLGVTKFLKTVAEMAKGLEQPTVKPIWGRDAIPSFPKPPALRQIQQAPPPTAINFELEYFVTDIPFNYIDQLKKQFRSQMGVACSTFDVVIAKAWQCRTRAIKLEPDSDVHLVFPVDICQWMGEAFPSPDGFYGNRVYLANATASSGDIADGSLFEVVDLIRRTKENMGSEFWKWARGDHTKDPFPLLSSYSSMTVPDWRPDWFFEVDYG